MNVIYCDLGIDNLKSFYVGMICNVSSVEYHCEVCGCVLCGLNEINMNCSCGGYVYPCVVI